MEEDHFSDAGLLYIMMIPNECLKVEIADRAGCEATIAAHIGADEGALNGWLADKVKPTFQSVLKVRDFLDSQVETRGGIAPIGHVPIRGNNPNGSADCIAP